MAGVESHTCLAIAAVCGARFACLTGINSQTLIAFDQRHMLILIWVCEL